MRQLRFHAGFSTEKYIDDMLRKINHFWDRWEEALCVMIVLSKALGSLNRLILIKKILNFTALRMQLHHDSIHIYQGVSCLYVFMIKLLILDECMLV